MGMNLKNWRSVKFLSVADIERSRKNIVYPAGSIKIQLSASDGQLVYMREAGQAEDKYGVISVKDPDVLDGEYLYYILEKNLPSFLAKYQSGMNINPEIFKYLKIDIHNEIETQRAIVKVLGKMRRELEREEETISKLTAVRDWHLGKMFPDLTAKMPRRSEDPETAKQVKPVQLSLF